MKKAIISLIICAVIALSAVCFSGCDVGATLNGWVTYITNAITGKGNDQSGDDNQTEEPDDGSQTDDDNQSGDDNQTEQNDPDDNNNPDETGVLSAPFINVDTQYAGENYCNLIVNITGGAHADIYYIHLNYNGMDMPVRTANSNRFNLGVSSANAGTYSIYVVASDSTGTYRDSAASETITVTLFE